MSPGFWTGRRVLVTGHTGFKGAWLSLMLEQLGAEVTGLALPPDHEAGLFEQLQPWSGITSIIGDVADESVVAGAVRSSKAEIVFHLAAQALVRRSYADPVEAFRTNTMGAVHVLDAARNTPSVQTVLIVTSDKVYEQAEQAHPFVETDRLGGSDPYSASKAVQEIVTHAYAASFFRDSTQRVATCRAGNVIGGGDWALDRLIPDFFRARAAGQQLTLRFPDATRPWQHVFEPLRGYLTFAERLHAGDDVPAALNFGPAEPPLSVGDVVTRLHTILGCEQGWRFERDRNDWTEHAQLTLDSSLARTSLDWAPALRIDDALALTAAWYEAQLNGADMRVFSIAQLSDYMEPCA